RDWTPRVTAAGELDYEATDAAFTQQFWGEYEESDTRSVWDGHQWRLQETERTRSGAYGAGVSNPLVQTKAGGAALDLGFYNGGHHSWGYEGKAVHAHFSPATLGPGPGEDLAFWDDSANPDMAAGPSLLRQDGGGVGGGQENDPAFNDVQAILRKFHEKYPGDEEFTKFFLSGGNIKIQELTRLWGDGTYSVGSGLAGDTIYLDKSQIDRLGPEMAADELKRVLTNLANNNGSQTHNFLDGFDPQRFLDNIEANQLPLSVFFRPTQMDGAAAGQFEGGFIAIIENAPGVGLYVVIGQGVTGERLTFAVPPGGNTQLSMGNRCLYLATGIGPVAMVVVGKGAVAVIKSLTRYTPDGPVPITLEELAQASRWGNDVPRGPVSPRHFADSPDGIRLFEEAKAFRGQLPGSAASKQYRNIAVADVIVDGQRRTVRFANTPEIPGKQLGIHSEERLIKWYDILKNQQGREVKVLSVFSDRIPCGTDRANCVGKLGDAFGQDLDVFFNILKGPIR
ncbi:MAG: hypothetical protein ACK6DB_00480, partial [Planctomycetota bacterium]